MSNGNNQPFWQTRPRITKAQEKFLREFRRNGNSARPTDLQSRVQEILARPGARTPSGMFNPRVVSSEDARLISLYEAQQSGTLVDGSLQPPPIRRPRSISPLEAVANIGAGFHGDVVQPTVGAAMMPFSEQARKEYGKARRGGQDIIGALGTAERSVDLPSARVNVFPGQGITLPWGGRLDEIDVGVKGALELALDPLNILPGVGFGPDILRGLNAIGKTRPAVTTALQKTIQEAPRTAKGMGDSILRTLDDLGEGAPALREQIRSVSRTAVSKVAHALPTERAYAAGPEMGSNPVRFASAMSSGGTVEAALRSGSATSVHTSELSAARVQVYNSYFDKNYTAKNIADKASLASLRESRAQHYHASPVCKSFSAATNLKTAKPEDLVIAQSVARDIREVRPPTISIENVPLYAGFVRRKTGWVQDENQVTALYKMITKELDAGGYNWDVVIANAADYGGAQNRTRILVRAMLPELGELPPVPKPTGGNDWYTLLKGEIDMAKKIPIAQVTGPKVELRRIRTMVESWQSGKRGVAALDPTKPIFTTGQMAGPGPAYARNAGMPGPTLTVSGKARIILPGSKGLDNAMVVDVTPVMYNKYMGLPDSYGLHLAKGRGSLAKEILGDGVHGAVTKNFIQPLVDIHQARRAVTGVPDVAPIRTTAARTTQAAPDVPGGAAARETAEEAAAEGPERGFITHTADSPMGSPLLRAIFDEDPIVYSPITNAATLEKASSVVNADPVAARVKLMAETPLDPDTMVDDLAQGFVLMRKASNEGNITELRDLSKVIAERYTSIAQSLQLASTIDKLTPEGLFIYPHAYLRRRQRRGRAASLPAVCEQQPTGEKSR